MRQEYRVTVLAANIVHFQTTIFATHSLLPLKMIGLASVNDKSKDQLQSVAREGSKNAAKESAYRRRKYGAASTGVGVLLSASASHAEARCSRWANQLCTTTQDTTRQSNLISVVERRVQSVENKCKQTSAGTAVVWASACLLPRRIPSIAHLEKGE